MGKRRGPIYTQILPTRQRLITNIIFNMECQTQQQPLSPIFCSPRQGLDPWTNFYLVHSRHMKDLPPSNLSPGEWWMLDIIDAPRLMKLSPVSFILWLNQRSCFSPHKHQSLQSTESCFRNHFCGSWLLGRGRHWKAETWGRQMAPLRCFPLPTTAESVLSISVTHLQKMPHWEHPPEFCSVSPPAPVH